MILRRLRNRVFSRLAAFGTLPFVVSVHFETTALCNFKCSMCPVSFQRVERKEKVLSFDLFKATVDDCETLVTVGLNNWGEPLLHPRITDMVEYASSKMLWTIFATNASLLTRELSRELIATGLTNIEFSIDGIGNTYRRIRNAEPESVINNIHSFIDENTKKGGAVRTCIVMTVSEQNETEIAEVIEAFKGKVDEVRFQPCLTFRLYKRRYPCPELTRSHLVVLSDGRVSPCCADFSGSLIVGDVFVDSLNSIYNGNSMQHLRKMHKQGQFEDACGRCSEYESEHAKKRFDG